MATVGVFFRHAMSSRFDKGLGCLVCLTHEPKGSRRREKMAIIKSMKVGEVTRMLDNDWSVPQDGGKYALICKEHGFLIQGTNQKILWSHARNLSWCDSCTGTDPRLEAK